MIAKSIALLLMFSTGYILWDAPLEGYLTAVDNDGLFLAEMDRAQHRDDTSEVSPHVPLFPPGSKPTPEQTVDGITARSNDWTEPSLTSENQYVLAIRNWLQSLEPPRREMARKIMRDAHPALHDLREAIRHTKAQLASISFGPDTKPETLPRLGLELQRLRAALHAELQQLKGRLAREAGVDMGPLGRDTFWLSLPGREKK